MTLEELLKRWSELEPERCKPVFSDYRLETGQDDGRDAFIQLFVVGMREHAFLLFFVFTVIADRNLRVQLQNASDGWHVKLTTADDPAIDCLSSEFDKEPAIALLTAYVAWLEKSKEVAA